MTISTPGIGSGLDVNGIVSKLMAVESQPLQTLAAKEASYQAKLSAFGSLSGALGSFQTALAGLTSPDTFQSLTTSVGDSTIFSATANSKAVAGTYNVNISKLAQAQTIATTGQLNSTSAIGDGTATTLTFQFGTISGGALSAGGVYTGSTYTQDPTKSSGTVTINAGNNSLQGIRDAVNAAGIGVTATIVSDGSATPDHLVFTSSKSGLTSSMKITVSGDQTAPLAAMLAYDPTATQNMTQSMAAQNTEATVNGIAVSSATTALADAIQGTTLNVQKTGVTTLTVAANTGAVQSSVNGFVKAYNDLNSTIKTLTAYDSTTKQAGLLLGDATTRQIQSQIRDMLSNPVTGGAGAFTNLTQLGIGFEKDGSMSLDSSKLTNAITNNFKDIGSLFATMGTTSDSLVSYVSSASKTMPGSSTVNISALATQGSITGSGAAGLTITSGSNDQLSVTVDGTRATINLLPGTYTAASLAAQLQSAINGTSAFSTMGISASVNASMAGIITITSNRYGSASNVNVSDIGAQNLLGTSPAITAGIDVAGSIGGVTGTGSGQILSGAAGSPAEGLKLNIAGGVTGNRGTVNFSQGYAYQLNNLINNYVGSSGTISTSKDGLNSQIKNVTDSTAAFNVKLAALQKQYMAEFSALDTSIASMNATTTYLTQQLAQISANTPTGK
ncbi:MAG TPA: flagellar filament capping protein FliD [Burkholderiaceae bacterium]